MQVIVTLKIGFLFVTVASSIASNEFYPFGDYEYYVEKSTSVKSYTEAETECENKSSTLVIINTDEIRNFLVNHIGTSLTVSPYSFYIGLKRFNNSAFLWLDGTLLSSDYLGWKQGEPNNKGRKEDCVIMGWRYEYDASFEWYDVECYEWTSRFICQRKRKDLPYDFLPSTTVSTIINRELTTIKSQSVSAKNETTSLTTTKQEGTGSPLAIVVGILVVILFIVAVIFILIAKKKRWICVKDSDFVAPTVEYAEIDTRAIDQHSSEADGERNPYAEIRRNFVENDIPNDDISPALQNFVEYDLPNDDESADVQTYFENQVSSQPVYAKLNKTKMTKAAKTDGVHAKNNGLTDENEHEALTENASSDY